MSLVLFEDRYKDILFRYKYIYRYAAGKHPNSKGMLRGDNIIKYLDLKISHSAWVGIQHSFFDWKKCICYSDATIATKEVKEEGRVSREFSIYVYIAIVCLI